MSEYDLGDKFSATYKKAKVGTSELILPKGVVLLPIFNASKSNEQKIELDRTQLLHTGYSSFVYEGPSMDAGLDWTFFKYIVCLVQRSNSRIVHIDFIKMARDLGYNSSNYKFYRDAFVSHINKGIDAKFTYNEIANNKFTVERFYHKITSEADDYFSVEISSTICSLFVSEFNKKLSYSNSSNASSGVAEMILEKLKFAAFGSEYELRLELFFKLLNLQGTRESKVKVLNRAIDNLKEIGFIVSCENVLRGGKIDSKKLKINKKYNLNKKSENFSVVEEESHEFKELAEKLHKLENESLIDDNLDDVLPSIKKEVAPAVISFSAGLDIMGCDFEEEKEPITDISGFDLEVDYDSWIDQSEIKRESTRVFEDESFTDYNPMP